MVTFESDASESRRKSLPNVECPNFIWGKLNGAEFSSKVDKGYDEVLQWRRNVFMLPHG